MGGIHTIPLIKVAFEASQGAGFGPAVNLGPAPVGHRLTRTLPEAGFGSLLLKRAA